MILEDPKFPLHYSSCLSAHHYLLEYSNKIICYTILFMLYSDKPYLYLRVLISVYFAVAVSKKIEIHKVQ